MSQVNISATPYKSAELRHYTYTYFNNNIAAKIVGGGDVKWASATGQQSCAIRMSIALAYAGVHWPQIKNSWRLEGSNVYFPSLAGDYPSLLSDPTAIDSADKISGQQGVIFFGGAFSSASGHVTLWDGSKCHHDDAYWDQPQKYFWKMA